jgi:S1-C subfamily serine protease
MATPATTHAFGSPANSQQLEAIHATDGPMLIIAGPGSGSGFFVTKTGVIVTNKHVVGTSSRVRVLNAAGRLYETESIYTDPDHDLALAKIDCSDCPTLTLADPASVNVGQEVAAIGSPGLAGLTFRNTVTRGVVSAFRGPSQAGHVYIQTDAQIDPGRRPSRPLPIAALQLTASPSSRAQRRKVTRFNPPSCLD